MNSVLTILLARVLGAGGYGLYTYVFSLVAVLAIPAQSGLPILVLRETANAHATEEWGIMRGIWRWANGAVGVISLVLALGAGAVALTLASRFTPTQLATFAWGLLLIPAIALGNLRGASLRGLQHVVVGLLPEFVVRPGLMVTFVAAAFCLLLFPRKSTPSEPGHGPVRVGRSFGLRLRTLPGLADLPGPLRSQPEPVYRGRSWLAALAPLSVLAAANAINQQAGILILGVFGSPGDVGTYRVAVQTGESRGARPRHAQHRGGSPSSLDSTPYVTWIG